MANFRSTVSELMSHRAVQVALAIVGVILVGSLTYYLVGSAPPALSYAAVTTGDIAQTISASGTVSPVENPTLSFTSGGRVTRVSVKVGDSVGAGQVLASLDTSVLAAQLAGAQAKLAELKNGPRAVDVASQQTAAQSASASLADTLKSAEAAAEGAVALTNPLYTNADTDPKLAALLVRDYDSEIALENERHAINIEIDGWRTDATTGTVTPGETLQHLQNVQKYLSDLSAQIAIAKPQSDSDTATLAADSSAVASARTTVNGLALSLNQATAAAQTAGQQLAQSTAGARPEEIAAQQASVDAIRAQIAQAEIIAPFTGTVAAVSVKVGDVVAPNAPGLSVLPKSTLEVEVYVSELDMTKLAVGDPADVTLDAYGSGRVFPAHVSVIDQAPTAENGQGGQMGYKVTLVFDKNDPAIATGMHANASMHGGSATGALLIPRAAVIENGSATYVLKKVGNGTMQVPVTLGLVNDTEAQVLSGLSAGDQVAIAGTH